VKNINNYCDDWPESNILVLNCDVQQLCVEIEGKLENSLGRTKEMIFWIKKKTFTKNYKSFDKKNMKLHYKIIMIAFKHINKS